MANLTFFINIRGVSSLSFGTLMMEIEIGRNLYHYDTITSGSEFTTVATATNPNPIYIPDNPILHNFAGQDVSFTLSGGIYGQGRSEMELKIFYSAGNTNNPVYTIRSGVTVRGVIISPAKIYTNFSTRRVIR